jgi:hypothetical protein
MMPLASQYWSYARECEIWASEARDEDDRKIFVEMAGAWVRLARKEQGASYASPSTPKAPFPLDRAPRSLRKRYGERPTSLSGLMRRMGVAKRQLLRAITPSPAPQA